MKKYLHLLLILILVVFIGCSKNNNPVGGDPLYRYTGSASAHIAVINNIPFHLLPLRFPFKRIMIVSGVIISCGTANKFSCQPSLVWKILRIKEFSGSAAFH
jgi:hypothetical protein